MSHFPELKTQNLLLQEISDTDAEELLSIHGDAQHMKWFGSDPLTDIDGARRLIQTFAKWREEPASGTRWGIQLRSVPGLIGTCGLFRWNRNWRMCVVGYEISPLHQGRGYMNEALAAVLTWGFREMELNRVEAHVHPDNRASLAVFNASHFFRRSALIALHLLLALALTLLSSLIQRKGPEQASYGNLCGLTSDQDCLEPVLNGGFPLGYIFDQPGVSLQRSLDFINDKFRVTPFTINFVVYFALVFALSHRWWRQSTKQPF